MRSFSIWRFGLRSHGRSIFVSRVAWGDDGKKSRVVNGVENRDFGVLRCVFGVKSRDLVDYNFPGVGNIRI